MSSFVYNVIMASNTNSNSISASELEKLLKDYHHIRARLGGIRCNPRKGFGSGDNARKASLARWHKK